MLVQVVDFQLGFKGLWVPFGDSQSGEGNLVKAKIGTSF